MNVLLIEDEPKIADFVCAGLAARGVTTEHHDNGHSGLQAALTGAHDVIALDIMLPGRDGLSVLQALRAQGLRTPVILLTARNELGDRVQGLELGADDYLAKPFYVEELLARLQALVRRANGERAPLLRAGAITLDCMARLAHCHGRSIDLTAREFSLLEYLMRSPGQVFTRSQILEKVWGYDFDPNTNVVDVCIKRLRDKVASLAPEGDAPSPIESVRGVGYRMRIAD